MKDIRLNAEDEELLQKLGDNPRVMAAIVQGFKEVEEERARRAEASEDEPKEEAKKKRGSTSPFEAARKIDRFEAAAKLFTDEILAKARGRKEKNLGVSV